VAVLERCDSEGDNSEEKVQKRTKYKKPQPAEFEKLEVTVSNEVVSNILRFFEIDENKFPTTQLVKHEKGMHKLYLVTRQSALLIENDPPHKIKLKSVGVRVFESMTNAQGSTCNYRITQDGVESLYPFLGPRRVIQINDTDFNVLFEAQDPLFDSFSTNTAQRLQEMEIGSVVFSYFAPMGPGRSAHHILLVGWRGKVSTQILIKPSEKPAILATFNARVKEE
jgi:tRNA (cytosine34-C5)-methyltransferase